MGDQARADDRVKRLAADSSGFLPAPRTLTPGMYAEYAVDPDPPSEGCLVYCIADNGSGKRELRGLFATGAAVAIATEP